MLALPLVGEQGTGTEEWGLGGDYWQGGEASSLALGGHPNSKKATVQSMCVACCTRLDIGQESTVALALGPAAS
jgi:hypothetical protein